MAICGRAREGRTSLGLKMAPRLEKQPTGTFVVAFQAHPRCGETDVVFRSMSTGAALTTESVRVLLQGAVLEGRMDV